MIQNMIQNKIQEKKNFILPGILVLFFAAIVLCSLNIAAQSQGIKPQKHSVSVDVMLIPVFVTSEDGNPVYNLTREDFELTANGIPAEIAEFIQYNFEHQQEITQPETAKNEQAALTTPSRAVFLVIDSVFNSFFGFRRAKEIAIDIIKKSSPGDNFIVLELRPGGGPVVISGPTDTREKAIDNLKKLKLPANKWNKDVFLTREWNYEADSDSYDPIQSAAAFENLMKKEKYSEQIAYKNQAHHFATFLSQLKYAMKSITRPKMVFLISEGIAEEAFKNIDLPKTVADYEKFTSALATNEKRVNEINENRDIKMFQNLKNIVKAMNEGGSVLYTINPGQVQRDSGASGEKSLRFLADESGGQYIAGSDSAQIVAKVKTTTAAYYELAVNLTPDMGKNINIALSCKRPGIKVHTLKQSERTTPYYRMEPVEKKLFALNLISGGTWSSIIAKTSRTNFKKLRNDNSNNELVSLIEVALPTELKDKQLDIFTIQIDNKTQKVNIELLTQPAKERTNLIIKKRPATKDFFVIIEPVFAYCIFNQVN